MKKLTVDMIRKAKEVAESSVYDCYFCGKELRKKDIHGYLIFKRGSGMVCSDCYAE